MIHLLIYLDGLASHWVKAPCAAEALIDTHEAMSPGHLWSPRTKGHYAIGTHRATDGTCTVIEARSLTTSAKR